MTEDEKLALNEILADLSSGVPMNSIPALSSASWIDSKERAFPEGTPNISSKRLMVATPTPDEAASSSAVIRNICLAALICSDVINLTNIWYIKYH